jgi:hypothetical protein
MASSGWIRMRQGLRSSTRVILMSRFLVRHAPYLEWLYGDRHTPSQQPSHAVTTAVTQRVCVAAALDVWTSLQSSIRTDNTVLALAVDDLDVMSGVPGIGQAMVAAGWVEKLDNSLRFPNFREHNTPESDRPDPLTSAERSRKYRERKAARVTPCHASHASHAEKSRVEKRVHKKNKKKEIILASHDAPLLPPLPQDIWEPSVSDAAVNQMLGTWWNDFGGAVSAAGFTATQLLAAILLARTIRESKAPVAYMETCLKRGNIDQSWTDKATKLITSATGGPS